MGHDYAAQRIETFAAFDDIVENAGLPESADVDYAFLPGPDADWAGVMRALGGHGYDCEKVEADADAPDSSDWLSATLPDQPISALAIWLGEEMATRVALAHGFTPDGWGFSG